MAELYHPFPSKVGQPKTCTLSLKVESDILFVLGHVQLPKPTVLSNKTLLFFFFSLFFSVQTSPTNCLC